MVHLNVRIWSRPTVGLIIALTLALPCSRSAADGDHVPIWRKPLPGTAAFLGDDGGGEEMATICDTAAHFREWIDSGQPPGCKQFSRGLPVVIEGVVHDPAKDTAPGSTNWYPLVKIKIPSKRFVGYLQLLGGIHPVIPEGTRVHFTKIGYAPLQLAPSQHAAPDSGPDLGEQVTAKVLQYDPSTGDRDIYVTIMDGVFAGQSGWMFAFEADGADGQSINIFAEALLKAPPPPPPSEELCSKSEFAQYFIETMNEDNGFRARGISIVEVTDMNDVSVDKDKREIVCHGDVLFNNGLLVPGRITARTSAQGVVVFAFMPDSGTKR